MNDITSLAIVLIFPLAMIFATFYDLFTMTIPNKITLTLGAAFFVIAPLAGMSIATMAWHVMIAAIVLVIAYAMFRLRAMGGGDAKLLAASALWFGPGMTLDYALLASIFGGLLTIAIIMGRRYPLPKSMLQVGWISRLHDKREGVPYGIALGPAALLLFPESPWMNFIVNGTSIG